jgi:hypothetical protein
MANAKPKRNDAIPANASDQFLDARAIDPLMSAVIALGSEFWAMQRRLLIVEAVLESKNSLNREDIERFAPSAEQAKHWESLRDRYIHRVYGFFDKESQGAESGSARQTGGSP